VPEPDLQAGFASTLVFCAYLQQGSIEMGEPSSSQPDRRGWLERATAAASVTRTPLTPAGPCTAREVYANMRSKSGIKSCLTDLGSLILSQHGIPLLLILAMIGVIPGRLGLAATTSGAEEGPTVLHIGSTCLHSQVNQGPHQAAATTATTIPRLRK
jgi:hypothetical protein